MISEMHLSRLKAPGLSLLAAALLTACLASMSRAHAEPANRDFTERLFGQPVAAKARGSACFVGRYDAQHLAAQTVSTIRLLVTGERDPESANPIYSFRLALNFRDRDGNFESFGSCGRESADRHLSGADLGCGVDCDGGGYSVDMAEDAKSVLIKIDHGFRIWKDKNVDESTGIEFKPAAGDKTLRLTRADADQCADLVDDDEPAAEPDSNP
jgi:hypothetical protein